MDETMLKKAVSLVLEKKGLDPVVLDISALTPIADYFLICSGQTTTQTSAIAEHLQTELGRAGLNLLRKEGGHEARWVLLDYGWLIIHVLIQQERDFYQLERLWHDARRVCFGEVEQGARLP